MDMKKKNVYKEGREFEEYIKCLLVKINKLERYKEVYKFVNREESGFQECIKCLLVKINQLKMPKELI